MIEEIVLNHLSEIMSVPVCMELPSGLPSKWVQLQKSGSSCENHVTTTMIVVNAYGESLLDAAKLNQEVIQAMTNFAERNDIASCRTVTDFYTPDTVTKRYRYQAVFDVTHY